MFITPAYAQTAGAATGGIGAFMSPLIPVIFTIAIFYLLVFRPQQRAAKAHKERIAAVKKGDSVVTGGGLIGKVTRVEDDNVEVEIATGVKVKAVKTSLTDVTPIGGAKPAND
ncbi:MAG: yajC [Sphingomonadales bacterium]|nr:yajC [Sphingomonadales bacterium]